MKKRTITVISFVFTIVCLFGCSNRHKLYFLNWGEYVDDSLFELFEEKYNCEIIMQEASSSEEMYNELIAKKTRWDVMCPGDYVVEKMIAENLLQELNYSLITNYSEGMYNDKLEDVIHASDTDFLKYGMPYFWGVYCMMYTTSNPAVKECVEQNGLDIFFNKSAQIPNLKVGMYDVEKYLSTAYLLNENLDVNTTNIKDLEPLINKAKSAGYKQWGTDDLKKDVVNGALDVIFTQLGDFFDTSNIYIWDTLGDDGEELPNDFALKADVYVPEKNVAFFDSLVIPKNARNSELANLFINFFMDNEFVGADEEVYEISVLNAAYVGYSPTIEDTINRIHESDDAVFQFFTANYDIYLDPAKNTTQLFLLKNLNQRFVSKLVTLVSKIKS